MRRPAVVMLAVLLAGAAVWFVRATRTGEVDTTRLGVSVSEPVLTLGPDQRACQEPIDLDRPVQLLGVGLRATPEPGPRLDLTVRDTDTNAVLASGIVKRGWTLPAGQYYGLRLSNRVRGDQTVRVCAVNPDRRSVQLLGKASISAAQVNTTTGADWAVFFPLEPGAGRSYLTMTPDIVRRASVLRPGIVTPAVYWVLAALLLLGGPFALWRAVTSDSAS